MTSLPMMRWLLGVETIITLASLAVFLYMVVTGMPMLLRLALTAIGLPTLFHALRLESDIFEAEISDE